MSKPREFKHVSLLRDATDNSNDNYIQETFNPRLCLIERSAYDKTIKALKEIANNGVEFETPDGYCTVDSNPIEVSQRILKELGVK